MAFNKNEVLLDRVRSLTAHDLDSKEILFRLTSLEEPTLSTQAEGEEITDAIGALITTLYRAKRATFSATNSLISLDLASAQYGSMKEVAGGDAKKGHPATITDYTYEIIPFAKDATTVTLQNITEEVEGAEDGQRQLKSGVTFAKENVAYIYSIEDNQVSKSYKAAAAASATECAVSEAGVITLPTGLSATAGGKIYVEYTYETNNALRIRNKASEFPSAVSVVIYAYFRDVCNENKIYSGKIICPKAKLSPEAIELALTSTGKHPFEFVINRDYCAEEGEDTLFEIILSE